MESRQALLDWKQDFLKRITERPDRSELEERFEAGVKTLSKEELELALDYLKLWKNGRTDGEKFYFSKKIAEIILRKQL